MKKTFRPNITERQELFYARVCCCSCNWYRWPVWYLPARICCSGCRFCVWARCRQFLFPGDLVGYIFETNEQGGGDRGDDYGTDVYVLLYRLFQVCVAQRPIMRCTGGLVVSPEGIWHARHANELCGFCRCDAVDAATPPPEIQQLVANIRVPGRASNLN